MFPFEVSLSFKSLDPQRAQKRKYFFACTGIGNDENMKPISGAGSESNPLTTQIGETVLQKEENRNIIFFVTQ